MMSNKRAFLVLGITFSILLYTLAVGGAFRKPDVIEETIYSRIENIKHMKHLELATYYFESMVEVTHIEKTDKVYLLMVIQARISC